MKLAACILMLSAGLCSRTRADDAPRATQPPVAQTSTASASAPNAPPGAAVDAATSSKPAAARTPGEVNKDKVVDVAVTEALIKKMRARGYKPVNRNGILVFCRSEGELGTRFERTRCNTFDELKDAEHTGQRYANQLQQQGSPTEYKPDKPPNPHR